MSGKNLDAIIKKSADSFHERFKKTFNLEEKGYSKSYIQFAETLMSNLIGGIGYFTGHSIVDRGLLGFDSDQPLDFIQDADFDDFFDDGGPSSKPVSDPKEEGPFSLFTATPSRPFFPRGFLWDEGFHQLIIGVWDNDLSLDIIKSWSQLIDSDGWVAREQILGQEARSKVPYEFQVQVFSCNLVPSLCESSNSYPRIKEVY